MDAEGTDRKRERQCAAMRTRTHANQSASNQRDADRVLDLLVDLVADRVRMRIETPDRRLMRIGEVGITARQIATLELHGVTFAKVGKYWMVEAATFDEYVARQRQSAEPANETSAEDGTAGIDPSIAAAFRRAAGGGRGRR